MIQPESAALRHLTQRALLAVGGLDPLAASRLGEPPRPPDPDPEREVALLAELADVHAGLEAMPAPAAPAERMDRACLLFGLRRALAVALLPDPSAARLLEAHLQDGLARLLLDGAGAFAWLVELAEAAPTILAQGRRPLSGSREGGELALESARRLPALLDAAAAAAAEYGLGAPARPRFEAALGRVLQSSAEEAGWLLKEFLAVATFAPPDLPDPVATGLGMSLDELEAEAEAMLAEAVVSGANEPVADPATDGMARLAGDPEQAVNAVREAVAKVAAETAPPGGVLPDVVEAPGWFRSLMPPLALLVPGPLTAAAPRLLVGAVPGADAGRLARALYLEELLPAAWTHENPRLARMLIPAAEAAEGWRAHVRETEGAAGRRVDPPWPRELAWRAALGLAAVNMVRGRAAVEQAAGMIAAESGLGVEEARLQALHVARRPLAALTFVAGRRRVASALHRGVPAGRLLAEGPLPAALIDESLAGPADAAG